MDFQLDIEDLVIGFGKRAILQVDRFSLRRGDKLLLTGESGCGKSQLLYVLTGLVATSNVWSGRFFIHQAGVSSGPLNYAGYRHHPMLQQRFSVVFQDARHSLHPYRSIARQCPTDRRLYRDFKLDPHYFLDYQRVPASCSGGECQRLSLLFPAHQRQRDILLLDEPLTDIDLIAEAGVKEIINGFLEDPAKTLLLVTHKPGWVLGRMEHYAIVGDHPPRSLARGGASAPLARPARPDRTDERAPFFRVTTRTPHALGCGAAGGEPAFTLWPLTLELHEGQALGLIGESGSGKSTLARIVCGLFAPRLYRRQFEVSLRVGADWQSLAALPPRRRYRLVQYVSQDSSGAVNLREQVGRNLDWIRRLVGEPRRHFRDQVAEWGERLHLFDAAGLPDFLTLSFGGLSMGMQRRLNLLRALLLLKIQDADRRQPKLLVLDEVSRGLDERNLERLADTVQAVRERFNVAVLAISHDLDFITRLCDDTRVIFKGALLPRAIAAQELADAGRIDTLFPYYRGFVQGSEHPQTPPEDRHPLRTFSGCLYARYVHCPSRGDHGCLDERLRRNGEIGVCD